MGNAHSIKLNGRGARHKKQVHWKAAACLTGRQSFDDDDDNAEEVRSSPPGKPELVPEHDVGTPDLVTLRWTPPYNDGGSPILGYLVEHRRVGSPHWVRATPLPVPYPEITLSGLEPGWRYQFRVSSENAVGHSIPSQISEPITVTLQRSAITAPKFTQELNDAAALENEKCEFVVHFLGQPAPKICWFKDGFEIFSSRRIRILTEHDRTVLTIHQTSLSDEGEIKCTATNRAGHVSCKAKLTVDAPPAVRPPRNYEDGLLFEIGEVIRLKVSVVGRPTPFVFWSHNGESLQNNDRYEIDYTDKSFSLKIADAQRIDRGEYQVRAVNKLGSDTASFLVTVTDKPSPPGKAKVVMTLGRSVTLSWGSPTDDGGCKIGNYIVEYYRLGWNVWLKAATSRQLSTRLGDLIEGSEYKFRIKAESPYGVSEPSEESDIVFIPDPKRGMTLPPPRRSEQASSKKESRSLSTPRVEFAKTVIETEIPPLRPKRTKSKSLQQTPESSPMLPRKDIQINKNIFDRASIARDLAYGLPELQIQKPPSPENVYKVKIEKPEEIKSIQQTSSPIGRKKFIREHSATVSGSSEFMLVLYSDENGQDQSDIFDDTPVAPPLSLSAPELSQIEPLQFNPLRSSASSTELLHERTMMRLSQAAEEEQIELDRLKERRPSHEIPKIRINSQESDDIVGLDHRHSLRRKMSSKWAHKRLSLKTSNEIPEELSNLKRAPIALNMKREFMQEDTTTSEELTDQEFDKKLNKKFYSQTSFEKKPVTVKEEEEWRERYEESLSESDTDSESSEIERFKYEMNKTRKVRLDEEEDTYRPVGGLSGMKSNSEPFEILNKRKDLPDPNFVPKPILKKTDSPLVSPATSPPSSPIKVPRALSPRPDLVLERNKMSLLAPELSTLLSSSEEESDAANTTRKRTFSLSNALPKLTSPKLGKKKSSTLPKVATGAGISAVTAASIVIPKNLMGKQKAEEEAKVAADHYDHIVKSVGQRRRSNPILDREELKKAAEGTERSQEEFLISSKEQTPLREENLSQDSGYGSYRRSSFTDHYDTVFKSPVRRPSEAGPSGRRPSEIKDKPKVISTAPQRRDSGTGVQLGNFASDTSGRRNSLTTSSKRSVSRSRSPSKRGTSITRNVVSPARPENWNSKNLNDGYQRRNSLTKPEVVRKSKTPSPARKPMLKEITTQTSGYLESFESYRSNSPQGDSLAAEAEIKVRSVVDWLTDLAMFAVACWLYCFENELLAIPILLIMVYRQLKEEVKRRVPDWLNRKWNKKRKKSE